MSATAKKNHNATLAKIQKKLEVSHLNQGLLEMMTLIMIKKLKVTLCTTRAHEGVILDVSGGRVALEYGAAHAKHIMFIELSHISSFEIAL